MADEEIKANETSTGKDTQQPAGDAGKRPQKKDKGDIPAGLMYANSYGVFQKVLKKAIEAPAPDKITQDFIANVWGFTGGSGMAVIPLLKKIDFLSSDGVPTEHYKQFRTETGRNFAIRHALRKGFPDIYRQTDFAENAKDEKVADIVLALTGRSRNDPTVRAILETFKVIKGFMNNAQEEEEPATTRDKEPPRESNSPPETERAPYNLSYHINIVLPETKEVEVFDAIFRKLKEHLL
jgi:hypothetical protein